MEILLSERVRGFTCSAFSLKSHGDLDVTVTVNMLSVEGDGKIKAVGNPMARKRQRPSR